MSGDYQVQWLCEALLVSRSGYYDWLRRRRAPGRRARENAALCERIRAEFERQRRVYGSPRLARALGMAGSRHRVARLMRQERLWARQRSKYRGPRNQQRCHRRNAKPRIVRSGPAQLRYRPNQRKDQQRRVIKAVVNRY